MFSFLVFCLLSVFVWKLFVLPVDRSPFLTLVSFVVVFVFCCAFEFRQSRRWPFVGCICFDGCILRECGAFVLHVWSKKYLSAVHLKKCF